MSSTILDTLVAEPPPLRLDDEGVVRIGGTRVTLDTVLLVFNRGCTAEEIVMKYPTLNLGDVYAVISYYLRHRTELDAYLDQRSRETTETRRFMEDRYPPDGIRERLLARKTP
ncbi:MAG: DUF433 domain-containing protein [Acidobacteriota bacterium]